MTAKCIYCGLDWNVSVHMKTPKGGYICPHCESKIRSGQKLTPAAPKKKGARK